MNLANFDFNINNYANHELEEIFGLPNNYDISVVDAQETKLRQSILGNNITSEVKNKTLQFISLAKNLIIQNIKTKTLPKQSSSASNKSLAQTYKEIYNLNRDLQQSEIINAGSTNIIQHPPTAYGQSSPSEFYQGVINPLNKRILRQNINIDTRFRENYYNSQPSNFHLDLPIKMSNVVSLQLSALELPTTFYVISKLYGNNFFVLEIKDIEPLLIEIPDGNYDYLTLQNFINGFISTQTLNALYKEIQFLVDVNTGNIATTTSNTGSGKMIVGLTPAGLNNGTQFSINFTTDKNGNEDKTNPLPLKLGWIMGFRTGYYTNNTSYVSEGIVDLVGTKYMYLVVDDFNNNVSDSFYGAFTSSILNKNILARISLQGSVFNILSQSNITLTTNARQYFGPVDIQKMQIQLLDEYGRIVDLNNMDYSMCLTLQTIYDL